MKNPPTSTALPLPGATGALPEPQSADCGPPAIPQAVNDDPEARALEAARQLDQRWHAAWAKVGGGLSPISLSLAWLDWAMHLGTQPAQSTWLALRAQQDGLSWYARQLGAGMQSLPQALQTLLPAQPGSASASATAAAPEASAGSRVDRAAAAAHKPDNRFTHPAWQRWPWAALPDATHLAERWWDAATHLRGMSPHHSDLARFYARQWLDMLSPVNWGLANPEVAQRTLEQRGANLVQGAANAVDDWRKRHGLAPLHAPDRPYTPGVDVAITPGRVVHRNALVELIQYAPSTDVVQAEPIFIVPSWIMKYYILDLSPHNSMVKWLVSQGHTVFILSWHNPNEADALLSMEDYLALGIFDPLAAIARLVPGQAVHACGYCLGGTLLAIGAAAMSRPCRVAHAEQLPALQTVTLLASITDFSEPGEMGVLIDESQVTLLEEMMAERGFLTGTQMAGSFAYLHSRELVWSQKLRELWLGEANQPNDLMAWNTDTTRMPAVMHSQYLRRCYLRNELALGRYPVEGHPVSLGDLHMPMFVVGTEQDHVSPWPAVYKLHRLADNSPITFVLTNGGHNAGIVSEPGHARRRYALRERPANGAWVPPEAWAAGAQRHEGSWWEAWSAWLKRHSHGQVPGRKPQARAELGAAPGRNVLVRHSD